MSDLIQDLIWAVLSELFEALFYPFRACASRRVRVCRVAAFAAMVTFIACLAFALYDSRPALLTVMWIAFAVAILAAICGAVFSMIDRRDT